MVVPSGDLISRRTLEVWPLKSATVEIKYYKLSKLDDHEADALFNTQILFSASLVNET